MTTTLLLLLLAGTEPAAASALQSPPTPTLTLADAERAAREHQPQLQQASALTRAAGARRDEARAALLPQVAASAGLERGSQRTVVGSAVVDAGPATTWSAGVTLSQTLWDFGQSLGRWRAAGASAEAQRASEASTAEQVLLTVRAGFFAARAAKDLSAVARDNLANQDAHLRQIEGFVELGTRPAIDLAQARADRATAEVQFITAENNYATARAQLNQAMGVEAEADYDVASDALPAVSGEDGPLAGLLAEALRSRPDVAALERQIEAQQLTVRATQAGHLPSLGIAAGLSEQGRALDAAANNWTVAGTLTWNLFQGGLTSAQVEEGRATEASLQAQLDATRQQVRLDVEQARLAVRAAKGSLGASAVALQNARERLRLAEGRYEAGSGSVIELGDAQVALTTAAAQQVQSEQSLSTARAQLLRALGAAAG